MSDPAGNAYRLAAIIRAYWSAQGHSPSVWVERQEAHSSTSDNRAVYVVRSDMVRGWPPATCRPTVPRQRLKFVSGLTADSASPLAALAAIRQRPNAIESPGPSNRVWRENERRAP